MKFQGVIPPVPTVFKENGKLDENGMQMLIDSLIKYGVHGLFFLGTGGEFHKLSLSERKYISEFVVQYVDKRVPVLIGTGSTNSLHVMELNSHSEKIGADGVVIINPYFIKLSDVNIFAHYSEIATRTKLPIILYNFPDLTGKNLDPRLVSQLVKKHENIVGIKDTIDEVGHIRELIEIKSIRPHFSVFCGLDDHLLNTLVLGGAGAISSISNFAPQLTIEIYESFKQSKYKEAIYSQRKLSSLSKIYKIDSPFISVIKEAIRMTGIDISTYALPPAKHLEVKEKQELFEVLKENNLI